MSLTVRDVQEHELDAILALNNAAGSTSSRSMAQASLASPITRRYFRVAEADGQMAGFLVALREGTPHESPNYRWFSERYSEFVYIDRIVIARPFRRLGLGRVFYADVQSYAEVRVPRADVRGVPRAARRHLAAVPRHLRLPAKSASR